MFHRPRGIGREIDVEGGPAVVTGAVGPRFDTDPGGSRGVVGHAWRGGLGPAGGDEKPKLPLLAQREIEARIVGPLIRAFADEIGQERCLAIVAGVIRGLARRSGAELARLLGEQTLEAFARSLDRWREDGA